MSFILFNDDCLDRMPRMDENSIDSIVTDPPYGLSFMGKSWDHGVPGKSFWSEALRVAKPGAHLLAFGGTRTYHRLACAIEDAGWEIRDCVMWVYGSGFPKSHNVGNAVDKHFGCGNRGHAISSGSKIHPTTGQPRANGELLPKYEGRTEEGKKWQGWGTALKPAWEPIIVARKPLVGTVAENVLTHGTGGLNVDGCRVEMYRETPKGSGSNAGWCISSKSGNGGNQTPAAGRWPANLIHDGSDEVLALFPDTGKSTGGRTVKRSGGGNVGSGKTSEVSWTNDDPGYGDSGSAARFFYCAKASKADRDEGCEGLKEQKKRGPMTDCNWSGNERYDGAPLPNARNHHPTVKPTALMRYLCRLVTPPGGVVLDPFMGSGSTGKAAMLERFQFIGIEMNPEYIEIAKARIEYAAKQTDVPTGNRNEHQRGLFDGFDDADGGVSNPVN